MMALIDNSAASAEVHAIYAAPAKPAASTGSTISRSASDPATLKRTVY